MKTYRQSMDELRFTPAQKSAMADALLTASAAPQARRPRRKRLVPLLAAILAALLCAACATGALQTILQGFSSVLGTSPEQVKTVQSIVRPLGASATCNGVTLSAEGVMGDAHTIYLFYSMYREDGSPLLPQTEDTKNVSNGDNTLQFEFESSPDFLLQAMPDIPDGFTMVGIGGTTFVDFQVDDRVLYFCQAISCPNIEIPTDSIEITFENLYSHECYNTKTPQNEKGLDGETVERDIPLIDGTWSLSFPLDYKGSGIDLSAGQTFRNEALTGILEELQVSPFALYVSFSYSLDEEALAAAYDPSQTVTPKDLWISSKKYDLLDFPFSLQRTDGSTLPLSFSGDLSQPGHAALVVSFDKLLPLDTVASITIGDLTIPVEQASGR